MEDLAIIFGVSFGVIAVLSWLGSAYPGIPMTAIMAAVATGSMTLFGVGNWSIGITLFVILATLYKLSGQGFLGRRHGFYGSPGYADMEERMVTHEQTSAEARARRLAMEQEVKNWRDGQ